MLFIRHTAARQPQPLIGQSLHGLMWLQNELDAKCKHFPVADPDLQMGGGGGMWSSGPGDKRVGPVSNKIFQALQALVRSKN